MEIRKGPFGHFICERIDSDTSIFEHSIEMINNNEPGNYLPVYIYSYPDFKEVSYDFSGYKSLNEISNININTRRKAIGDLFLSFHRSLDLLLPLNNILVDGNYFYTNEKCEKIYVCYKPVLENTSMRIDSLVSAKIESLLTNSFFKDALSSDEINHLIFSIKNNDEELYVNTCRLIQDAKITPNRNHKMGKYFIPLISLVIIIASYFFLGLIPALVLLIITISYFLAEKAFKPHTKAQSTPSETKGLTETRKQVLFDDNSISGGNSINALFIESLEKVNGEYINNAIYTQKATIGSDYFLSDICINDSSVTSLNAEILLKDGVYTLTNIANTNNISIEGIVLQTNKEYELKNGQTITIGRISLKIKTGF